MGFLKVFVWSVCCIGLGMGLAKVEIGGRTPLEHAQQAWKHRVNPSKLDQLKNGLGDAMDEAKDKVEAAKEAFAKDDKRPRERHSAEDRDAVNKLIAKRSGQK